MKTLLILHFKINQFNTDLSMKKEREKESEKNKLISSNIISFVKYAFEFLMN